MRLKLIAAAVLAAAAAVPAQALAQGSAFYIDAGTRVDERNDGTWTDGGSLAFGFMHVLGGTSSQQFGSLVPISIDFRYSNLGIDMNGDLDWFVRAWNISVGAGLSARMNVTLEHDDVVAPGGDPVESFSDVVLGYSVAGKFNFGPQSRAYVQARLTRLSWQLFGYGSGETCNEFGCIETYMEEYTGGTEQKLSAGYAFGSGNSTKVLRFQLLKQNVNYEHANNNLRGAMDRTSRTMTLGLVIF
jgi:hypothetical protein